MNICFTNFSFDATVGLGRTHKNPTMDTKLNFIYVRVAFINVTRLYWASSMFEQKF